MLIFYNYYSLFSRMNETNYNLDLNHEIDVEIW